MEYERNLIRDVVVIDSFDKDGVDFNIKFSFNRDAEIFKEHFVNNPILPGAFIIELIRSFICKYTQDSIELSIVKNITFLSGMTPELSLVARLQFSSASMVNSASFQIMDLNKAVYSRGIVDFFKKDSSNG